MKKLLILVSIFCALKVNAQDYYISFAGTGASATVSTVKVENLAAGTSLIINGSDILHLTDIATGIYSIDNGQPSELKIYPNPMTDYSTLEIFPPVAGDAVISVLDITGKPIVRIQSYLESCRQEFRLTGIKNGFYLINVKGSNYQFSGKLISNGNSNLTISIEKVNSIILTVDEKKTKTDNKGVQANVDMEYATGDRLKFTGISGNYSTVKTDIPESDETITFNFTTCSDGDANNYPVVEIGTQVWMAENLKTTKFSDGTDIPLVEINAGWIPLTTPCYGWYYNNEAYKDTRGGLYNWYAVDVSGNSNKNVCPTGWHVPFCTEWVTMENYLIANGYNYDGSTSGNKIALSLAAATSWFMDPEPGMPNGTGPSAYLNKSGFTAIMTGVFTSGDFSEHKGASWWSATEFNAQSALSSTMSFMSTSLNTGNITSKICGYSVRCLKD